VENALKREGVKVISLEDRSFQEIVEMFSSASTVIGVSGDALANTIFSRPGTNVIELLPDTWVSSLQKEISAKAQLSHNYLACEAFGEGRFNQQMALYDSIQIPIDRLLSLLSDLENI
jgi:capsular polysaccharide biosynthesis protein